MYKYLFGLLFIFLINSCSNNGPINVRPVKKFSITDPFKYSMTNSQLYEISTKKDHVLKGDKGSIFVFPKNCFIDKNGNYVNKKIKIELAETFTLEDLIHTNLTAISNGKVLESGGMFFINATHKGEQLTINPNRPVYVKLPTNNLKGDMQIYKGIRDDLGNMNWVEPKPIDNYLVAVEMDQLNFLPKGFAECVEAHIPFKGHKKASRKFVDSLYFSFSGMTYQKLHDRYQKPDIDVNMNEGNKPKSIGGVTVTLPPHRAIFTQYSTDYEQVDTGLVAECFIDPAIIKTIKSRHYRKTYLASKEFETRIQVLFELCSEEGLELYIKNVRKNLWEVDLMVYELLKDKRFEAFAALKHTKVKANSIHEAALNRFYKKKLAKNRKKIAQAHAVLNKAIAKQNKEVEELAEDYAKQLDKREKYRMKSYNFELRDLGWINIDKPNPTPIAKVNAPPKKFTPLKLKVRLANSKKYDRAYVYFISADIHSLHRMDRTDSLFTAVENHLQGLFIPSNTNLHFVTIGYIGRKPFINSFTWNTGEYEGIKDFDVKLERSSEYALHQVLKKIDQFNPANQISQDLKYQAKLYAQQKRIEETEQEYNFMRTLYELIECCQLAPERNDTTVGGI